jgi:adenylate kinase
MRLILLGAPGVGKGTQAKMIASKFGISHISSGEMLRKAVSEGSEVGLQVKSLIDNGQLVPDDLMIELVHERIDEDDCANGYILDGFPRTVAQAEALDELFTLRREAISRVILFDVSDDELCKRLSERRGAESRADDTPEIQERRLRVYREQTAPLIRYYEEQGLLSRVEASGKVDEVQSEVLKLLVT